MNFDTIKVCGIDLDVYFDIEITTDAYGTGDSPTLTEVDIKSIELAGDTTNLTALLSDHYLDYIESQIVQRNGV